MSSLEYGESTEPIDLSEASFDWFGDRDLPDDTYHNTRLVRLAYDLSWTRFRAEMTYDILKSESSDSTILSSLLSQLHSLDIRLDEWFDGLPEEWWPSVMTTQPREDVWNSVVHVFSDRLLADMFDMAAVMRIIIHGRILDISFQLGQSAPAESTYAIQNAADSICGSIPWLFGSDALGAANPALGKQFLDPLAWCRGGLVICMKWIPWPAHCSSCVPEAQRRWLKQRLEYAGRATTSAQAATLAQQIEI